MVSFRRISNQSDDFIEPQIMTKIPETEQFLFTRICQNSQIFEEFIIEICYHLALIFRLVTIENAISYYIYLLAFFESITYGSCS